MNAQRLLGCALTAAVAGSMALAAAAQPNWQATVNAARAAESDGRIEAAIAQYSEAVRLDPPREQRAEIYLQLGVLSNRKGTAQADLRNSADFFYQAMQSGTGDVKAKAASNYGAQLVRLGESDQAAQVLSRAVNEFRDTAIDSVARSRLLFNYASALENEGQTPQAREYFKQAYAADASFAPARDAFARLALGSPSESTGIPDLIALTRSLVERSDFEAAIKYMNDGIATSHWTGHPQYSGLVAQLAAVYAAARVSPEQFKAFWPDDRWATLVGSAAPSAARRFRDIHEAYLDSIPATVLRPDQGRSIYSAWSSEEQKTLSALLKTIGDHYFRSADNRSAFPRYARAWALDSTNLDAGMYLGNILASDPAAEQLGNEFVSVVFDEKLAAYLGEDWESILRFHTILGTFFERTGRWGPEFDTHTASFQWRKALDAHAKIAAQPGVVKQPVPDLRESLARAYANDGQRARAREEYRTAAREYESLGRGEDMQRALGEANRLGP